MASIRIHTLNGADWKRVEDSLRRCVEHVGGFPSEEPFARTLDKVERINKTGKYSN